MASEIYTFVSPFDFEKTIDLISLAMNKLGKVESVDKLRGYILAKYRVSALRQIKIDFFVERGETACKVRANFKADLIIKAQDKFWDKILYELFSLSPNTNFCVTMANGNPYMMGILYLGSDTMQVFSSHISGGTSLVGFLLGGAAFGTAGAIVGGMSGSSSTYGSSHEEFADKQLVRLLYNNGRIWEGRVKRGSKLHNEIMVNMK